MHAGLAAWVLQLGLEIRDHRPATRPGLFSVGPHVCAPPPVATAGPCLHAGHEAPALHPGQQVQCRRYSTGNTRAEIVPCCIHRPTLLLVLHTHGVPKLRHNVLGSFSMWATVPCLVPLSIVPFPSSCARPRLSIPCVHRTLLSAPHSSGSFTHLLLSFFHSLQEVNNALEDSCNHVVQGLPR